MPEDFTEISLDVDVECDVEGDEGPYCGWSGSLTVSAVTDGHTAFFEWDCPRCERHYEDEETDRDFFGSDAPDRIERD